MSDHWFCPICRAKFATEPPGGTCPDDWEPVQYVGDAAAAQQPQETRYDPSVEAQLRASSGSLVDLFDQFPQSSADQPETSTQVLPAAPGVKIPPDPPGTGTGTGVLGDPWPFSADVATRPGLSDAPPTQEHASPESGIAGAMPRALRLRHPEMVVPLTSRVLLGRDPASPIAAHASINQYVSSRHALVEVEGAGASARFWITDTNSTNGTTVNGAPIPSGGRRLLLVGDVIQLTRRSPVLLEVIA